MKICKKCKAVISVGLEDLLDGKFSNPKLSTTLSQQEEMCKECFELKSKEITQ